MYKQLMDLAHEMRYREQKLKEDADLFARMAKNEIEQKDMLVAKCYLERANEYIDNAKIFGYFAERLEDILEVEDEQ